MSPATQEELHDMLADETLLETISDSNKQHEYFIGLPKKHTELMKRHKLRKKRK